MPFALTIGVPYELFWHLTPSKLPPFYRSYKQKQKARDQEMWIMGQYVMSALDATVCNNSLWKGKNGTPSKYVEKPITFGAEEKTEENAPLTEEEKRKQTEQLFMRLKIMGANHKRNNKNKDSTVS